ncbi:MAG: aminotransferase [Peptococcaceae bacterium BICA1-7]|nr:MAG: aminotransferase [Peptococcaceae bacterium BICA1-7]HBV98704.1 aminotransferase class V-fold PLP-dependent enzyme [Desulfotomaculum sp.]
MKLKEFELERYFAQHEFKAPYLLCCSDCESFTAGEILETAGDNALESFLGLRLGYTESRGNPFLRKQVADLYTGISPEDVLVTAGAEEAIFIFMNAALKPGDHIIVQYPCYQSLSEIARSIGCAVTRWECHEENGWEPDLNFLEESIKENTRAIIINSPHNPTGYLMPAGMFISITEIARQRGIIVFSDEVYRFLEYEWQDRHPSACEIYENAVSLGVMSKSYGLPGLRIGWVSTQNSQLYRQMASFKDYTSICSSAPGEFLASSALSQGPGLISRNLDIIKENLTVLDPFFSRYESLFSWRRPKAGPIAFPMIKGEPAGQFCLELLNSTGVLLLPGSCYSFGDRHFRIGFGRKNMPECISRLEEFILSR